MLYFIAYDYGKQRHKELLSWAQQERDAREARKHSSKQRGVIAKGAGTLGITLSALGDWLSAKAGTSYTEGI